VGMWSKQSVTDCSQNEDSRDKKKKSGEKKFILMTLSSVTITHTHLQ